MKIECRHCKESFEVPDGKGINRAICPFCEKPNDLRKPSFLHRSSKKEASMQDETGERPAKQSHPLAPQLWIISICTLVITIIIVVSVIMGAVVSYKISNEMEEVSQMLNDHVGEAADEMNKSIRQLQQNQNRLLKP